MGQKRKSKMNSSGLQFLGYGKRRGLVSEIKAYQILKQLKEEGWIVDFMSVSEIPGLDKKGIDYLVIILRNGKREFKKIDIKSSEAGVNRYNRQRLLGAKEGIPIMVKDAKSSLFYFLKQIYS